MPKKALKRQYNPVSRYKLKKKELQVHVQSSDPLCTAPGPDVADGVVPAHVISDHAYAGNSIASKDHSHDFTEHAYAANPIHSGPDICQRLPVQLLDHSYVSHSTSAVQDPSEDDRPFEGSPDYTEDDDYLCSSLGEVTLLDKEETCIMSPPFSDDSPTIEFISDLGGVTEYVISTSLHEDTEESTLHLQGSCGSLSLNDRPTVKSQSVTSPSSIQDDFTEQEVAIDVPNDGHSSPEKGMKLPDSSDVCSADTAVTTSTTMEPDCEKVMDFMKATVSQLLQSSLPPLWSPMVGEPGIHVLKYSGGECRVVQRSVYISVEGKVSVFVHGKLLPPHHLIYEKWKDTGFCSFNVSKFVKEIVNFICELRLFDVCCGVSKIKYKKFWFSEGCVVDSNPFHEIRYRETCRSNTCEGIVPQRQRKCAACSNLVKKFTERPNPATPDPNTKQKTPNKFKSHKHCTSAEKKARARRNQKTIKNLRRENERLRMKIATMIEKEGLEIDDELDGELKAVLEEECAKKTTNATGDDESDGEEWDFQKLFIMQQLESCKRKGVKGFQWHPLIIRFALQLKMLSSTAYSALRSSGFVSLPSERTLFDYSHAMEAVEGCHNEIIADVSKQVCDTKHDYQKYHIVSFDEVTICQNLVQKKSTGDVIGYCKLNEVQEEILKLETTVRDSASNTSSPTPSPPIAKKMLCYMVKGAASGVESVVASYCVSSLSKEDLYLNTWEVIERLELSGIKVVALVCDGSTVNRGFFDMHPPKTKTSSGLIFDTVNPYDPSRVIYFISDPPHLLKTIRNCFSKSGRMKNRRLTKGGQCILWSTITKLYTSKEGQTVSKLHKLDGNCVFLNSYSCMKVRYAARVLSQSVANALRMLKWPNVSETCVFRKS